MSWEQQVDQNFQGGWRNADSSKGVNRAEIQSNRLAAERLMPISFLVEDLDNLQDVSIEKAMAIEIVRGRLRARRPPILAVSLDQYPCVAPSRGSPLISYLQSTVTGSVVE